MILSQLRRSGRTGCYHLQLWRGALKDSQILRYLREAGGGECRYKAASTGHAGARHEGVYLRRKGAGGTVHVP